LFKIIVAIGFIIFIAGMLLFYALNGLFKPIGKAIEHETNRLKNEANEEEYINEQK
jgi:hypothetical protein